MRKVQEICSFCMVKVTNVTKDLVIVWHFFVLRMTLLSALLLLAFPHVFYCCKMLAIFEVSKVKLMEKISHSFKGIMYKSTCAYNKHVSASVKHKLYYSVVL